MTGAMILMQLIPLSISAIPVQMTSLEDQTKIWVQ